MQNTLALSLWPAAEGKRLWRNVVLVLVGAAALTLSAKVSIPFYPVPLTMQTFVVLTLGMAYGWKLGASTVVLYLMMGAAGLPVFAGTPEKGIGLAYMFGTTGGYLLGFVLAAALCGYLAECGWGRTTLTTAAAMLFGNVIIYVPGLLWLGTLVGWDKPVFEWGLIPFLFGDLAKLVLAAGVLPLCWKLIGKRRG